MNISYLYIGNDLSQLYMYVVKTNVIGRTLYKDIFNVIDYKETNNMVCCISFCTNFEKYSISVQHQLNWVTGLFQTPLVISSIIRPYKKKKKLNIFMLLLRFV